MWFIFAIKSISLIVCLFASPASAFDWDYSEARFDLTYSAVNGSTQDFHIWRREPFEYLKEQFLGAIEGQPEIQEESKPKQYTGYKVKTVVLRFPHLSSGGADLIYTVLIATPDKPRAAPTVIAINGHGEVGGEGSGEV